MLFYMELVNDGQYSIFILKVLPFDRCRYVADFNRWGFTSRFLLLD